MRSGAWPEGFADWTVDWAAELVTSKCGVLGFLKYQEQKRGCEFLNLLLRSPSTPMFNPRKTRTASPFGPGRRSQASRVRTGTVSDVGASTGGFSSDRPIRDLCGENSVVRPLRPKGVPAWFVNREGRSTLVSKRSKKMVNHSIPSVHPKRVQEV